MKRANLGLRLFVAFKGRDSGFGGDRQRKNRDEELD